MILFNNCIEMEIIMSKWNKKFVKLLTAASLAASLAVCAPCAPLGAYAATSVTDGVMIRNDASTDAGIIGSLNEGDEVEILDVLQSGDGYAWYYIQLGNGNKGYVRSDLISADDSELAAFQTEEPKEEPQEEAPAEPAEEEAQNQDAEAQNQDAEAPAEASAAEATASAPEDAETVTTAAGYDAYSDPAANIVARFETDENGEGNWYVFNDDNGTRIKVRDIRDTQDAPAAASTPGIWRPLAIVFGILALAFAALALYLIKSIRDSRTKSSRRRAIEADAANEEDEEEDDEFYFEDDEPDDEPEDEGDENAEAPSDQEVVTDSTIEVEEPAEADVTEIPAEEIASAIAAETVQIEKSISQEQASGDDGIDEEAHSEGEDLAAADAAIEEDAPAVNPAPAEETAPAAADADTDDTVSEAAPASSDENDGDYAEDDEEAYSDEDEDYVEDDDYEDEEYEDGDYEDEDYDDDEEEEEERKPRSKNAGKGGFFGFISKIFGSSSREDEDEGEDFDEEEEERPAREFDEFKEYPEDIDLLPRDDYDEKDDLGEEEDADSYDEETGSVRDRLTMQKVMKNVDYREVETDFEDEDMDGLFDDDDDMEYSFISSTRRK